MSPQFRARRLPPTERLCIRFDPCIDAEVMQQAIVGQPHHVRAIPLPSLLQRSGIELNFVESEWFDLTVEIVASENQLVDKRRRFVDGWMLVVCRRSLRLARRGLCWCSVSALRRRSSLLGKSRWLKRNGNRRQDCGFGKMPAIH